MIRHPLPRADTSLRVWGKGRRKGKGSLCTKRATGRTCQPALDTSISSVKLERKSPSNNATITQRDGLVCCSDWLRLANLQHQTSTRSKCAARSCQQSLHQAALVASAQAHGHPVQPNAAVAVEASTFQAGFKIEANRMFENEIS